MLSRDNTATSWSQLSNIEAYGGKLHGISWIPSFSKVCSSRVGCMLGVEEVFAVEG